MSGVLESSLTTKAIQLVTGNEWKAWKFQVQSYAYKLDATDYLTAIPADPATAVEVAVNRKKQGELWYFMVNNIGPEFGSLIMSKSIPMGRTDILFHKLCEKFEESSEMSIAVAVDKQLGFTADGLTISKFVADILLLGEQIKTLVPTTMTVSEYIDLVTKQALLKRLPDAYDSYKTMQRSKVPASTLDEVRSSVLREEMAIISSLTSISSIPTGSALAVGGTQPKNVY